MIFKLKFGGGNLFSPAMTSTIEGNNSVGVTFEATVEEGDPRSGLKNVMCNICLNPDLISMQPWRKFSQYIAEVNGTERATQNLCAEYHMPCL
jgi:hypothetical protein